MDLSGSVVFPAKLLAYFKQVQNQSLRFSFKTNIAENLIDSVPLKHRLSVPPFLLPISETHHYSTFQQILLTTPLVGLFFSKMAAQMMAIQRLLLNRDWECSKFSIKRIVSWNLRVKRESMLNRGCNPLIIYLLSLKTLLSLRVWARILRGRWTRQDSIEWCIGCRIRIRGQRGPP